MGRGDNCSNSRLILGTSMTFKSWRIVLQRLMSEMGSYGPHAECKTFRNSEIHSKYNFQNSTTDQNARIYGNV